MSAEEEVKELLRHQLEYSEGLSELVDSHDWEEIDTALIKVCGDLVSSAESPERKKSILLITLRIGQSLESKDVVKFAKEHLEEWSEKYE